MRIKLITFIALVALNFPYVINSQTKAYYNTSTTTENNESRWMANLDDKTKLTEMSIPGTHDTASLYGGDLAETQSMSIPEQLKAGIRFLDIRCRVINNALTIHHGRFYQHITFAGVLQHVSNFLKVNPGETVLMRVKQEYSSASNAEFISIYNNYVKNLREENRMYEKPNPKATLGEVRGKIIIIEQVHGLPGIYWNSLKIQDDYSVPTLFHIPSKYRKVLSHIDASGEDLNNLYLNFASGVGAFAYPYSVAYRVNRVVYERISNELTKAAETGVKPIKTGIIVMDYPGDELIKNIIKLNQSN